VVRTGCPRIDPDTIRRGNGREGTSAKAPVRVKDGSFSNAGLSNQYHNAKFAERCRAVGLIPVKGYRGWSQTELSDDLVGAAEIVDNVNNKPEFSERPNGNAVPLPRHRPGRVHVVSRQARSEESTDETSQVALRLYERPGCRARLRGDMQQVPESVRPGFLKWISTNKNPSSGSGNFG
jgi:hypothetical protein